jgi:hypothetical protein
MHSDLPPSDRLAAAAGTLAGRVSDPVARAQLHALAALLDGYEEPVPDGGERAALERAITAAIGDDDEAALIPAMRRLAALDRAAVRGVNWSAASGG